MRLIQSHTQSHKTSVAAVKNLVVAILIHGDDIENFLKATQLLAASYLERAMAYRYFALMMEATQHLYKASQVSNDAVLHIFT